MIRNHLSSELALLSLLFMGVASCSAGVTEPGAAQGIGIEVQPRDAQTVPGGTVAFRSVVTGTAAANVLWEVVEVGGGTVDSTGLYTAPQATGQYHVRATSVADPSARSIASVTVTSTPTVSVRVAPSAAQVQPGGSFTFLAVVTGAADTTASWSLQEATGCGSITQGGVYAAPGAETTCHVVATSNADPSKSAVATVTVTAAAVATDTLRTQGRYLLDTCGNPLVLRGVDQGLGFGFATPAWDPVVNPAGGSLENLIDDIARTGANAVRFLLNMAAGQPGLARYEELIQRAGSHRLVVFISYYNSDIPGGDFAAYRTATRAFWADPAVQAMIDRARKFIIIDAYQEGGWLDRAAWRDAAIESIGYIRSLGYTVPVTATANRDGRDLPGVLQYGAAVTAADPLRNALIMWEAYWGSSGWYQSDFGGLFGLAKPTSIANGVEVASRQSFPIILDFTYWTDPREIADYESGMAAAAQFEMGWTWWMFNLPFGGRENSLLNKDVLGNIPGASLDNLTLPFGPVVVNTSPYSLRTNTNWACGL